ncbi:hypothetical protein JXA88_10355 [Candidatus Fermentibacteria bacterium]|nr:hypothetical protein [Candidatus Fermentibacteria bacterium]
MRTRNASEQGVRRRLSWQGGCCRGGCLLGLALTSLLGGGLPHSGAWATNEIPLEPAAQESTACDTEEAPALRVEPAADVRDPVLSFLVGLLRDDILDTLEGDDIRRVTAQSRRSTLIPLKLLERMGRGQGPSPDTRIVSFWLTRDGKVPAPYSLLGYHPGSVLIHRRIELVEWHVGRVVITERGRGSFALDDCYVWAVHEGRIGIDIDAFIDRLLGGSVDDMTVNSLALFRLDDVRYAMAMGYNKKGKGRSGALHLRKDEIEFPSSWQLRSAGKLLRRKVEGFYLTLHTRSPAWEGSSAS